ncbi:penicillin-binding transpeptidase domain-containing protein [Microbispora sp. NPDC049125]|uniref:penicillin-binding transpeptidase domain-containing protein n=1 Tax=Microbispora sp. NPDC049125 TaxID=3154929 RepID=UPI003465CA65
MRNRALIALVTVAATIFVSGVVGLIVSGGESPVASASPSGAPSASASSTPPRTLKLGPEGSPEETAASYLRAWSAGDFETMREMVDDAPADFLEQHRLFEDALMSQSVRLTPDTPVRTGEETADVSFTQVRQERDVGEWSIASTLHLAIRDLTWKVLWTPAVLYPQLATGGTVERTTFPAASGPLTREGKQFPQDSHADAYLQRLGPVPSGGVEAGWAIELTNPGQPPQTLLDHKPPPSQGVKTTIEWTVQAAAARALDGVAHPAAVVAVRPSTGEILAVADQLGDRGAFERKYAPGSTFKAVTAAALLNAGLTPDATVQCPASYQIPNHRLIPNYHDEDHGTVTFRQAFALSCNTSFVQLAVERLTPERLVEQAQALGFGVSLETGVGGTCGSIPLPQNTDEFAEDSFGQGKVEATPLCMALVAAAAKSGEWRPPRFVEGDPPPGTSPQPVTLPAGVAAGLRDLMSAVTTEGTAAGSTLPDDVAGKTGTAEDWQGGADHAWFIGYQGDLAFAVFIEHGGTGREAAVPVAARFLHAL